MLEYTFPRQSVSHNGCNDKFFGDGKPARVILSFIVEWRAYSYKQPTKRLLKRLKGNFIKGYQLKIHTVKE